MSPNPLRLWVTGRPWREVWVALRVTAQDKCCPKGRQGYVCTLPKHQKKRNYHSSFCLAMSVCLTNICLGLLSCGQCLPVVALPPVSCVTLGIQVSSLSPMRMIILTSQEAVGDGVPPSLQIQLSLAGRRGPLGFCWADQRGGGE